MHVVSFQKRNFFCMNISYRFKLNDNVNLSRVCPHSVYFTINGHSWSFVYKKVIQYYRALHYYYNLCSIIPNNNKKSDFSPAYKEALHQYRYIHWKMPLDNSFHQGGERPPSVPMPSSVYHHNHNNQHPAAKERTSEKSPRAKKILHQHHNQTKGSTVGSGSVDMDPAIQLSVIAKLQEEAEFLYELLKKVTQKNTKIPSRRERTSIHHTFIQFTC